MLADGQAVVRGTADQLGGRRELLDAYLGQRVLDTGVSRDGPVQEACSP